MVTLLCRRQADTLTRALVFIGVKGGFHAEILTEPIRWEKGYIIPPTKPGLGVEINEEVAAKHPYIG